MGVTATYKDGEVKTLYAANVNPEPLNWPSAVIVNRSMRVTPTLAPVLVPQSGRVALSRGLTALPPSLAGKPIQ
jgi:hypothetical protein